MIQTANNSDKCGDSGELSDSEGSLTNKDSKLNRSFVCSFCGQRYLRHSRLLVHLRTHVSYLLTHYYLRYSYYYFLLK